MCMAVTDVSWPFQQLTSDIETWNFVDLSIFWQITEILLVHGMYNITYDNKMKTTRLSFMHDWKELNVSLTPTQYCSIQATQKQIVKADVYVAGMLI